MATEEEVVIRIRLESDLAAGLAKDRAELEAFKKSLNENTTATSDSEKASEDAAVAFDDLAESHGSATTAIRTGTKAKQDDQKVTNDSIGTLDKFINKINKFGTDFQSTFAKNERKSKDFYKTLNDLNKVADDGLRSLVTVLGDANKSVAALAAVAGGAKLALTIANGATKVWNGTLTLLAASLGAVAVAASGALAAIQEVQSVQLSPFFGGSSGKASSFLTTLYGDRNLASFKKDDVLKTAQQLLSAGVPSNQIQTAESSVGGISLASGQTLKAITKDVIDIAQLKKLTSKNIQPFLGILPQLDAALKQSIGEKGTTFAQNLTGDKIPVLQSVNTVLDKENNTLIGKAKGWIRIIQSTLTSAGQPLVNSLKRPLDTLGSSVDGFLHKHLPQLIKGFSAFLPGAITGSQTALDRLGKKFDDIMPTLLARFDRTRVEVDRFFDHIRDGWDRIKPSMEDLAKAWDAIWQFIKPIASAIGNLVGGVLREFSDTISKNAKGLSDAGTKFADFIKSLKPFLSDISDIIAKIVSTDTSVVGVFKDIFAVIDPVVHVLRDLVDWLDRVGALGPIIRTVAEALIAVKVAVFALKAITTVTNVIDAFSEALKGMAVSEIIAKNAAATTAAEGAGTGVAGAAGLGGLLSKIGIGGAGAGIGLADIALPIAVATGTKIALDHTSDSGGNVATRFFHRLKNNPFGAGGVFSNQAEPHSQAYWDKKLKADDAAIQKLNNAAAANTNQQTVSGFGLGNQTDPTQTLKNVNSVASTFSTGTSGAVAIIKYFGLAGDSAKQLTTDLKHISAGGAQQVLLSVGLGSAQLAKQLTAASSASSQFHDALSNALEAPFNVAKTQASLESDIQTLVDGVSQKVSDAVSKSNLGNVVQDIIDAGTQKFAGLPADKQAGAISKFVISGLTTLVKDNPDLEKTLGGTILDTIGTAAKVAKLPQNKLQLLADPGTLIGSINQILNGFTANVSVTATPGGGLTSGFRGTGTSGHSSGGSHVPIPHFNSKTTGSSPIAKVSDTTTSRFMQTLTSHSMFDAMLPGARTIASGLRNFALGSLGSDHLNGYAFDLTGDNLVGYANNMNQAGGFAEFHGDGDQRHLHVVPPHGDTSSPWVGRAMSGSFQPIYNVNIYAQPSHSPHQIANMAMRALDNRERDRMERS